MYFLKIFILVILSKENWYIPIYESLNEIFHEIQTFIVEVTDYFKLVVLYQDAGQTRGGSSDAYFSFTDQISNHNCKIIKLKILDYMPGYHKRLVIVNHGPKRKFQLIELESLCYITNRKKPCLVHASNNNQFQIKTSKHTWIVWGGGHRAPVIRYGANSANNL